MHRSIRISFISLLVLPAFILKPAWGAVDERPTGSALQFGVYRLGRLTSFEGATISYQRFLSRNAALRVGLTVQIDYSSTDDSEEGTGELSGRVAGDIEEWNNSFSLNCEYLVYRGSAVSLFYGGGPYIAYGTRQDEAYGIVFWDDGYSERTMRNRERTMAAGLTGTFGVQWAPFEWCAFHAEYRALAAYNVGDIYWFHELTGLDESFTEHDKLNIKGFVFDSKGVRFGLSIYF